MPIPSFQLDLNPDPALSCLGWTGFGPWIQPQPTGQVNWYDPEVPPLTWGPAYKEADGRWAILSACPLDLVEIEEKHDDGTRTVEYRIGGGPILWESFTPDEAGLTYSCRVDWRVAGFRFCLPLRHESQGGPAILLNGDTVELRLPTAQLRLTCAGQRWELAPTPFALGETAYRHIYLQGRGTQEYVIHLG